MSDLNDARKALLHLTGFVRAAVPSDKADLTLGQISVIAQYFETSVAQKIEQDHAQTLKNLERCARVSHEGRLHLARIEAQLQSFDLKEQIAQAIHNGTLPSDFYTICPLAAI